MSKILTSKAYFRQFLINQLIVLLFLVFFFSSEALKTAEAATFEDRYPSLSMGLFKSALLVPLESDTLLIADDGITIKYSQLLDRIKNYGPQFQSQIEKNLLFLLEQEAVWQILLNEAKKVGIAGNNDDTKKITQALFENQTKTLSVSKDEVRLFYETNKDALGGSSFEQLADSIHQYLLQTKKQQTIDDYIRALGESHHLRINKTWAKTQSRLAIDNPIDKARLSGKPTMAEFGARGCIPCDMMQPILDRLRKNYSDRLNVIFIQVRETPVLAARYGISSIPVQVFFDKKGQEIFRHIGFLSETEVTKQLVNMGVKHETES